MNAHNTKKRSTRRLTTQISGLIAFTLILIVTITITSCEEFLTIDPPKTQLTTKTIFTNDATAISAIVGIYERMNESLIDHFASGSQSITLLTGLASDELLNYSSNADQTQFYSNTIKQNNSYIYSIWAELYRHIYSANAILEGLNTSQSITLQTKNQLEGEAKFIRAFCYFYLANLYSDVPLAISTDYTINENLPRTSATIIFEQIIADLISAKNLLPEEYIASDRIRPNKWTASALLSRSYLYIGDWKNAETEATSIINASSLYSLSDDLNNVFIKRSNETIWQLQPVAPFYNTFDGRIFILSSGPNSFINTVSLRDQIINSFDTEDKRKANWIKSYVKAGITYYYPFKYKIRLAATATTPADEYLIVFRLAEQYLIRAEARMHQNDYEGTITDLNIIRSRAGLTSTTANDENTLTFAIEQERLWELFTEWGHRWFDLKRNNKSNAILGPLKAPNWESTDIILPIPQSEIQRNKKLQND